MALFLVHASSLSDSADAADRDRCQSFRRNIARLMASYMIDIDVEWLTTYAQRLKRHLAAQTPRTGWRTLEIAASACRTIWDDAKAAGMSEPELLLYRSNLLGADKRITNYGGGNTSAKVMEKDPLTGETVEVLWVKGSGGDVGTMKLDGFATLYMDEARGAEGLYRGRRARGRDGRLPAALHLQPQPARRLDRHAAARLRAARRTSTTCTPTRSSPSPRRRTRRR